VRGRRESPFLGAISVSTFVTPKNVTSPAMQCTACQHFQTGPSSSATLLLQRPAPLPGAYILMNLSSYSIQFRPLCHSFYQESPWLNQSHPSETTVLVTHSSWQRQSQTCICCRVPFTPASTAPNKPAIPLRPTVVLSASPSSPRLNTWRKLGGPRQHAERSTSFWKVHEEDCR
jgi:hypothetical protein